MAPNSPHLNASTRGGGLGDWRPTQLEDLETGALRNRRFSKYLKDRKILGGLED
jgi:hypothetical protein